MQDKYIEAYENYLKYNKIGYVNVPKKIRILLKGKDILDYACGGGGRAKEFLELFNLKNAKIYGYDINKKWKSFWENNLKEYNYKWLNKSPKLFHGIIYCAHAIYMPDVKKEILSIFKKSKAVLAIRAFNETSIFKEITSEWNISHNMDWEDKLKELIGKQGFNYETIKIPTKVTFPESMIKNYLNWAKTFVKYSGSVKSVENILRKYKEKNVIKLDNSDIIYFITKNFKQS